MEPLKLLKFLRDDIYEKSIAGSYLSPKEANEVIETLRSFIESLRVVRNSNELTKKELQKINELPGKISPGIKFWLFKLLADDDSFSRAYDLISKEINTKQLADIPLKNLSDAEILEIIEVENEKKQNSPKYKPDNKFLLELYRVCFKNSILKCTDLQFLTATANGDFSDIDFLFKTRGQYLVFQMKKILGNDWYEDTIKSKGWTKDDCNKFGKNFHESNGWADKVHQVIANYNKPQ